MTLENVKKRKSAGCIVQPAVNTTCRGQGEYEEADLHYTRAIEIGERILGPQNLDLAGWLNNRAVLLEKQVTTEHFPRKLLGA